MGQTTYPPEGGSVIKSVQRGTITGATTATISAVNIAKTWVRSYPTESSGNSAFNASFSSPGGPYYQMTGTVNFGTGFIAKQFGAYLTNSTTITSTGSCRYEVIEYN